MFVNKMYEYLKSSCESFSNKCRVVAWADNYLFYAFSGLNTYAYITILRSSQRRYRVISFVAPLHCRWNATYLHFGSLVDLACYLDALSLQLV